MTTKACMGGWCQKRDGCRNHTEPTNTVEPVERICDEGDDGVIDGFPMTVYRGVGTWTAARPLAPAHPFGGLLQ